MLDPENADHRITVVLADLGPDGIARTLTRLEPKDPVASFPTQPTLPHLTMPAHHDVRPENIIGRRLHATLAAAAERGPVDFADLLMSPGVGARTVQALAAVAEIVHGAPSRFSDPARYSLALGGKDRHPFPVPIKAYDETIRVMTAAVSSAKLGSGDQMAALQRLDQQARLLEGRVEGPTVERHIEAERRASAALGGRSIFGVETEVGPATPQESSFSAG